MADELELDLDPIEADERKPPRPLMGVTDERRLEWVRMIHADAEVVGNDPGVMRFNVPGIGDGRLRLRDALRLRDHPEWIAQATVRRYTASGRTAREWLAFERGLEWYGYAWVYETEPATLGAMVVLNAFQLLEDIQTRPGCLVRPSTGRGHLHHAPGGAEFYTVDLTHIREQTIATVIDGVHDWDDSILAADPAPVAVQESLL